jgi:hypothetical protein
MKYILALIVMLAFSARAETNTNTTPDLSVEIASILSGVHQAGSEIYTASKEAIVKSIDFVSEQTPLVVKEFLRWKLLYHFIWITIFVIVSAAIVGGGRKLYNYGQTLNYYKEDCVGISYFIRYCGYLLAIISISHNAFPIAKILYAPRVYLLEYVLNVVK